MPNTKLPGVYLIIIEIYCIYVAEYLSQIAFFHFWFLNLVRQVPICWYSEQSIGGRKLCL